jgi:cytoskeletal protein CcmA (bactofilin family)
LKISTTWLQIDGCVLGDVMAKSTVVTIGPSGSVVGTVHADTIFLAGQVSGQMVAAHQIACAASANFDGHMLATQLSIQAGARITGTMALRHDTPLPLPVRDCA